MLRKSESGDSLQDGSTGRNWRQLDQSGGHCSGLDKEVIRAVPRLTQWGKVQ